MTITGLSASVVTATKSTINSATGDLHVTATNGAATVGDVTSDGGVYISATNGAASLHSATLTPGYGANVVQVAATGTGADATIGGVGSSSDLGLVTGAASITMNAGRNATVDVSGPITLQTVQAGAAASLTAQGLLTIGSATAGTSMTVQASSKPADVKSMMNTCVRSLANGALAPLPHARQHPIPPQMPGLDRRHVRIRDMRERPRGAAPGYAHDLHRVVEADAPAASAKCPSPAATCGEIRSWNITQGVRRHQVITASASSSGARPS